MRVFAGLEFGGATLTAFDDLPLGFGSTGDAVWGPNQLLRDLELRLGVGVDVESDAVRVAKWAARVAELAPLERFYSRSFAVDALGTGHALLRFRDSLVEAGWEGQAIPEGGARLDALVELEGVTQPMVPLGYADRLARVERSLSGSPRRLYAELVLAEPAALWSSRWRAVFEGLQRSGTGLRYDIPSFPGANPDTDLGRVQVALRARSTAEVTELRGDGSFVLFTRWPH